MSPGTPLSLVGSPVTTTYSSAKATSTSTLKIIDGEQRVVVTSKAQVVPEQRNCDQRRPVKPRIVALAVVRARVSRPVRLRRLFHRLVPLGDRDFAVPRLHLCPASRNL